MSITSWHLPMILGSGHKRYVILNFQVRTLKILCSREENPDLLTRRPELLPHYLPISGGLFQAHSQASVPDFKAPSPHWVSALCRVEAGCCSILAPRDIWEARLVPEDHSDESSPFNFYPHASGTSEPATETTNRCQSWPGFSGSCSWLAFPQPLASLHSWLPWRLRPVRPRGCVSEGGEATGWSGPWVGSPSGFHSSCYVYQTCYLHVHCAMHFILPSRRSLPT